MISLFNFVALDIETTGFDFEKDEIRLSEELISLSQPIYKKWWFYAGTAAVVTAAILISSGGEEEVPSLSSTPPAFPGSQ